MIFGRMLRELAERRPGYQLIEVHTEDAAALRARPTSTSTARTGASARPSCPARAS